MPTLILTGPARGEVARPSDLFTAAISGSFSGTVRVNLAAPDCTFSPPYVDLTEGSASAPFTCTADTHGSRTITATASGGAIAPATAPYFATIQTGVTTVGTGFDGVRISQDWGGFVPNVGEYNRPCYQDELDPLSPSIMARTENLYPGRSLYIAQDKVWNGRACSYVNGSQAQATINLGIYLGESDTLVNPLTAPIPPNPGVSGWITPPTTRPDSDSHISVVDVDSMLHYGLYRAWWNAELGRWEADGIWIYDLVNGGSGMGVGSTPPLIPSVGQPWRMGWTSETTAGVPLLPLTLRYDEAVRNRIGRALRITTSNLWNMQKYVWPGRHHNYAGPQNLGLPFGARVRLNAAWYFANRDRFGQPGVGPECVARNVLDAMYLYGLVSTDGTAPAQHFDLEMVVDSRWPSDFATLFRSVPISAFEVPMMTRGITVTANKTYCYPGQTVRVTSVYNPYHVHGDRNFAFNGYPSRTDGVGVNTANVVLSNLNINPTTPGNHWDWSPTIDDVGDHHLLTIRDNSGNLKTPSIAFTVLAPGAPEPDPQPAPGDPAMTWPLRHFLRRKGEAVTPTAPDSPPALAWRPLGFLLRKAATVATPEDAPPALAWRPLGLFFRKGVVPEVDPETLPPDLTSAVRRLIAATPSLSALSEFSMGRASPDAGPTYSVVHHTGSSPLYKSSSSEWTTERLTFRIFARDPDTVNAVGLAFEAAAKSWRAIDYRYGYALPLTEPQRRLDEVRARRPGDKGSFVYELTYSAKCRRGRD